VYPDGETVTYDYDRGGQIKKVTGRRMGMDFEYVKEIGYDEWGQRSYIEYGNNKNQSGTASGEGVKTYYTYDENRRWLKEIKTLKEGREYQKIEYTFDKVGNVEKYENKAGRYVTGQDYSYDELYQLTGAEGHSTQYLYDSGSIEGYRADYKQTFEYDIIGNMTRKTSRESKTQQVKNGMSLNYEFDYQYYGNSHKAERIGDMYYRYDGNGNVVEERYGGHSSPDTGSVAYNYDDGLYSADYGFALTRPGSGSNANSNVYERRYTWDYRNQLLKTKDNQWTVNYRYGYDGQRTVKYTEETRNETLYFNSMWQTSTSGSGHEWLQSKHIFVGESRIATKSNKEIDGKTESSLSFENEHQYWYHSDHLGSAQLTTTRSGELHERIEYTPYGEIWIEHKYNLAEGRSVN